MGIRASVQDCMESLCSSAPCLWWWPTAYAQGVVWSSTSMQGEMFSLKRGNSPASAICDSGHPQSMVPVMSQRRRYSQGREMHSTHLFLITGQHIRLFCHWPHCFPSLAGVTALWSSSLLVPNFWISSFEQSCLDTLTHSMLGFHAVLQSSSSFPPEMGYLKTGHSPQQPLCKKV